MLHAITAYEEVMREHEVKMDKDRQRKRQLERRQHRKNRDAFEVGWDGRSGLLTLLKTGPSLPITLPSRHSSQGLFEGA